MEIANQSCFCEELKKFNDSELYKLILYSASIENKTEDWEVNIGDGYISGKCNKEDSGIFWRFLIENGLADRLEIIKY